MVLPFEIGTHRYAIAVDGVREVVRAVRVTPLPGAPPVVAGVIDLRGRMVPVIDLGRRHGLAGRPLRLDESFLVIDAGARTVALRADGVSAPRRVEPADVEPARSLASRADGVADVLRLPDGLALICDAGAFLSRAEAESIDEALRGAATTGETGA